MAGSIRHRGPDDEGIAVIGRAGLAHRRLSIIDLGGGHQPMATEDGALTIVFNGEIYNFPEVRRALEGRGHAFRTRSDTEVLLYGYREWGPAVVERLNGMFAFALWDAPKQTLFAARDRLGKKPLYYTHRAGRFLFGSEIKAILADPDVDREIDPVAIDEYLSISCIAAPRSVFRHVRKLPPAHRLLLRDGTLTIERYWTLRFEVGNPPASEESYLEGLDHHLKAAVERRLISDVPLGALLSGGVDSSAVVGTMARLVDRPVKTFSIGFDEREFSELEDARVVARHFRTEHHEYVVRPSAVDVLPRLVWHFDEPFGDSSAVPTYYVSQMAAANVKVVLSGDGGDELFAGYARYLKALDRASWGRVPEAIRRGVLKPLAQSMPLWMPGRNTLYAVGHHVELAPGYGLGPFPYVKEQLCTREFRERLKHAERGPETAPTAESLASMDGLSRLQYLDTMRYLPDDILAKVDRASMAHSLECRAPLLDYQLVEYAATIPPALKLRNRTTKYLFKRLCERFLPPDVLTKRKQGFAVPKGLWFRTTLADMVRDRLLDSRALGRGYFRPSVLHRVLRYHRAGQRDYSDWLWNLLVLEEWHRVFVDPETRQI
jgi:asparagine synthase (glutamine-hydrolysing)